MLMTLDSEMASTVGWTECPFKSAVFFMNGKAVSSLFSVVSSFL
jgi:hypothetical protein